MEYLKKLEYPKFARYGNKRTSVTTIDYKSLHQAPFEGGDTSINQVPTDKTDFQIRGSHQKLEPESNTKQDPAT